MTDEPLTDDELDDLARRVGYYAADYAGSRHCIATNGQLYRLVAEVRRLRAQAQGHAERIAGQSEILSRRAEKLSWSDRPPLEPGWYWWSNVPGGVGPVRVVVQWDEEGKSDARIYDPEADVWDSCASLSGQWAGPLTPPA